MLSYKRLIAIAFATFFSLVAVAFIFPHQSVAQQARRTAACPVLLRVINAANPSNPTPVRMVVNGREVTNNVLFRAASSYVPVIAGVLDVQIVQGRTNRLVGRRRFVAAPNSAFSIAVTGPVPGPVGQKLFNKSPFVIQEDLTPPNPGKFKGRWYRFSETAAVIDFRASTSANPSVDVMRIRNLNPKTAIEYPEITAGTYNFNPVLPDSSAPLVNAAFTPPVK